MDFKQNLGFTEQISTNAIKRNATLFTLLWLCNNLQYLLSYTTPQRIKR